MMMMWRLVSLLLLCCCIQPTASFSVVVQSSSGRTLVGVPPQAKSLAVLYSSPGSNSSNEPEPPSKQLPTLLDPGTKGGALFYMTALFAVPYTVYQVLTVGMGMDEVQTGITIGAGFTILSTVAWMSTYLFRVATKDMTYVRTVLIGLDWNLSYT